MVGKTDIEWATDTWNPITGCHKVSPGCKNCYAETFAERFRGTPGPYEQGFDLKLWPERLDIPIRWKKPRVIFVNSMSDLFHKDIPQEFLIRVFDVMREAHWHTFQVLTKRSDRLLAFDTFMEMILLRSPWAPNIWQGVSVENGDYKWRIDQLRQTHAKTKFLSIEPLIGPVGDLDLTGIHWVIVGGESGPGARIMEPAWASHIRDQCAEQKVPFFMKQFGAVTAKQMGMMDRKGGDIEEFPEWFKIREFPDKR